jgi:hypothetical protein
MTCIYYISDLNELETLQTTNPTGFAELWFYIIENSLETARKSLDGLLVVFKIQESDQAVFTPLMEFYELTFQVFTYAEILIEMEDPNWTPPEES